MQCLESKPRRGKKRKKKATKAPAELGLSLLSSPAALILGSPSSTPHSS